MNVFIEAIYRFGIYKIGQLVEIHFTATDLVLIGTAIDIGSDKLIGLINTKNYEDLDASQLNIAIVPVDKIAFIRFSTIGESSTIKKMIDISLRELASHDKQKGSEK